MDIHDEERIEALYKDNSIRRVATIMNCSKDTVRRTLIDRGVKIRTKKDEQRIAGQKTKKYILSTHDILNSYKWDRRLKF